MELDEIEKQVLKTVAGIDGIPEGAYNFRVNGKSISRSSSENIDVKIRPDKKGLEIFISGKTRNEAVHIPVIISKTGLKEVVYNDFYIEDGADVTIVAGCGIYNCGAKKSVHNGVHTFHVGNNCKVKYIEKHYGMGAGAGKILNPKTEVFVKDDSSVELELEQIKGVDSTERITTVELGARSDVIVHEKTFSEGRQTVNSEINVSVNGDDSRVDIVSRAVARDKSKQKFSSNIIGNSKCRGHSECDAILMDEAQVLAVPSLDARNLDAELIHEAAIGKIAGEQIEKLMTLGLYEEQAVAQIINGFLA
ncbi:SufD family Fe-S cluster assembly protein [Candidatus Saccharibacteria bacterium]|nr:SufD family Fe-S cluster assembly protein [Candidatus Saccharibacteria bacterium]